MINENQEPEIIRVHCQFCFALFEPVPERVPSETCDKCWLEIHAQINDWQECFEK